MFPSDRYFAKIRLMDSSFGNHDCSSGRLEVAILNGDVDDMEDVLRRIPDLTDRRKKSLFEAAVYTSNRDVILCLLRHGILPKEESSIFNSIQQVFASVGEVKYFSTTGCLFLYPN